jgi:hypothetical protein
MDFFVEKSTNLPIWIIQFIQSVPQNICAIYLQTYCPSFFVPIRYTKLVSMLKKMLQEQDTRVAVQIDQMRAGCMTRWSRYKGPRWSRQEDKVEEVAPMPGATESMVKVPAMTLLPPKFEFVLNPTKLDIWLALGQRTSRTLASGVLPTLSWGIIGCRHCFSRPLTLTWGPGSCHRTSMMTWQSMASVSSSWSVSGTSC